MMKVDDSWQQQRQATTTDCLPTPMLKRQKQQTQRKGKEAPLTLIKALIGECLCGQPFPLGENRGLSQSAQCIELLGVQFIGLGAVVDELSPRERVYDTLEQLTVRTERLISIGYLIEDITSSHSSVDPENGGSNMKMETVPLDVWNKNYPNDLNNMSRPVKRTIDNIKAKEFDAAITDFEKQLKEQKAKMTRNNNNFLVGITAHNLGVLYVLKGHEDQSLPLFQQAVELKKDAFGPDHPEVAISLDELGIQYFARKMFVESLEAFNETRRIRAKEYGSSHPGMAMVLNNIACCNFQMGNPQSALATLQEAREILNHAIGTSAKADLDLLHIGITLSNLGYLQIQMKEYDTARSIFEEALLIQQSVLGDNHRAVRDTLSNIEFTNAFHS